MTDPDRISQRSTGLAAELLRSSADEQPGEAGMQRTLAALGVSAAVLSASASATGAATQLTGAASNGIGAVAGASTAKAASATLLVKWIGIGVVSGVGLAGVATAVSPASPPSPSVAARSRLAPASTLRLPAPALDAPPAAADVVATTEPSSPPSAPAVPAPPRVNVSEREPNAPLEVGAPLAEEVQYVDRARALLASGQAEPGLSLLSRYEREFPQARLLPEVLFLQLETYARLDRTSEARRAAERIVDGFPRSPHAARARRLLAE